jgi:hypothetical protein
LGARFSRPFSFILLNGHARHPARERVPQAARRQDCGMPFAVLSAVLRSSAHPQFQPIRR